MPNLDILHQPLHEIVAMVRTRVISPLDLVLFSIERTKLIHRNFNVIVEDRFQDAVEEARSLEAAIARGEKLDLPLLGIPFSVKANISVKGMRLDMGAWAMHGSRAAETATALRRLQAAGAILLCTTNLSEMGLWHDTVNPIYGRTLNPWKTSRLAGGSSGGEAVLVAAGGTIFGIGTDMDGSIRIPSSFCGTFGHRPSRGIVPLTGQFPFFKPEDEIPWRAIDSLGPMTRHARDLSLLLDVLNGPCAMDPMSMTGTLNRNAFDIQRKHIGIIENPLLRNTLRTAPEVRLAMHKARLRLIEAGAKVSDAPRDLFAEGFSVWRLLVHRAVEGRLSKLFGLPHRRQSIIEILKWFSGQADHSLAGCVLMLTDQLMIQPDKLRTLDSDLGMMRRRIEGVLQKLDAIVMPVYPELPPHYQVGGLLPLNLGLTGLINAIGLPSTAAPVSISSKGLPIGAQVIAKQGDDLLTIYTSEIIGEFIPPPIARGSLTTTKSEI